MSSFAERLVARSTGGWKDLPIVRPAITPEMIPESLRIAPNARARPSPIRPAGAVPVPEPASEGATPPESPAAKGEQSRSPEPGRYESALAGAAGLPMELPAAPEKVTPEGPAEADGGKVPKAQAVERSKGRSANEPPSEKRKHRPSTTARVASKGEETAQGEERPVEEAPTGGETHVPSESRPDTNKEGGELSNLEPVTSGGKTSSSLKLSSAQGTKASAEEQVTITIGRIEVRAVLPEKPPTGRRGPAISLEDYRKMRREKGA